MPKVGRFVVDPGAGADCQATLDNGEKILVSHDQGGFEGGRVTITTIRWWDLAAANTLLSLDLDNPSRPGGAGPAHGWRTPEKRAGDAAPRRRGVGPGLPFSRRGEAMVLLVPASE